MVIKANDAYEDKKRYCGIGMGTGSVAPGSAVSCVALGKAPTLSEPSAST